MSLPFPEVEATFGPPPSDAANPQPALPGSDIEESLVPIAVGLAAGFLAMRALFSSTLAESPAPASEATTTVLLNRVWSRVRPLWISMTLPAVLRAYELGSTKSALFTLREQELLAQDYVMTLGDSLHSVSAQAVVDGYYAQLRNGFSERLAWERAANGYGLDGNQFRSWIQAVMNEPRTFVGTTLSRASRATLDKLLLLRADRIGKTESYHAVQVGKSVFWLMAQANGDLPADTQKMWVTARDERVCSVCGPLDGVTVALAERFVLPTTSLWAPGAHPNCRCEIELIYDSTVEIPDDVAGLLSEQVLAKADYGTRPDGSRYWDVRDENGEFATRAERAKPKRRLEVLDRPAAEEIAAQVAPVAGAELFSDTKEELFSGTQSDLFGGTKQELFADSKQELFTDSKQELFTQSNQKLFADQKLFTEPEIFNKQKIILRRIVFINGKMEVVDSEVEADQSEKHPDRAFMLGSTWLHHYEMWMYRNLEPGEKAPRLPVYKGAIIDLDYNNPDPDVPIGQLALLEHFEMDAINEILVDEASAWVDHQAMVARQAADRAYSDVDHNVDAEFDFLTSDIADSLSHRGQQYAEDIMRAAVDEGGEAYRLDSGMDLPMWIETQYLRGDRAYVKAVDAAFWREAIYLNREGFAYAAEDATAGVEYVPTIFQFEGFRGSYLANRTSSLETALLEGKYEVVKVETKRVTPQTRQLLKDNESEPFEVYRLITLVPKKLYDEEA